MNATKFATYSDAVASILPTQRPDFWVGVVSLQTGPVFGRESVIEDHAEVVGNPDDGYEVIRRQTHYLVVSHHDCETNAAAAVDHNAGHRETGWYTQHVYKTGVHVDGARVTIRYAPRL